MGTKKAAEYPAAFVKKTGLFFRTLGRHGNRDLFGHHWGIVWDMRVIRKHQLQRVLARRKIQRHFRLTTTEML